MRTRMEAMGLVTTVLLATACAGGSTGVNGSNFVIGGASTTIVASGSSGGGGGGTGGYGGVTTMSDPYYFSPAPDTVAVGAVVTFAFMDVAHTVTFDQLPGEVSNIPATSNADSTRVFSTPGTYTYHCTIHTYMHGTVVAQ
jgi:plastocyanin